MIYFFEDIQVGWHHEFGDHLVTRDAVIDFASQFDPQPFHLLDDAAAQTHFGRVAASGWHSCAMAMRMLVDHWATVPGWQEASLGAFGVEDLRFIKPVYPGDRLRCSWELLEKRESLSRRQMGIIKSSHIMFNQDGEKVLSHISTVAHKRRPAPASS